MLDAALGFLLNILSSFRFVIDVQPECSFIHLLSWRLYIEDCPKPGLKPGSTVQQSVYKGPRQHLKFGHDHFFPVNFPLLIPLFTLSAPDTKLK